MRRGRQQCAIEGGHVLLNLRSIVKSNRWDGFRIEFTMRYYTKLAA